MMGLATRQVWACVEKRHNGQMVLRHQIMFNSCDTGGMQEQGNASIAHMKVELIKPCDIV
jgi:hypothetical protein